MNPAPEKLLKTFPNPEPKRAYEIAIESPEFTCVCPMTGNPDFAILRITYSPAKLCVELKSLKLYLFGFRNLGTFHEAVTNRILDNLVALLHPRTMTIVSDWNIRGGLHTVVTVRHGAR
ncbi:MAG: NADPH-dependent 7-cyano-7-deazaguanine reductase QueF [Deltaproteobacteria bacterium]|nr:NADPH-dependent 7-cyano-7-deazaguanine reductase QueF [Deltaproteobacteria bacterium]